MLLIINILLIFYVVVKKLVIECDGGKHSDCLDDIIRDDYLKRQGYKILRFWNNDILSNLDGCLLIIMQELEKDL